MTMNTTSWHDVAALDDEVQVRWMTEHGRIEDESVRRQWMRDLMAGVLDLSEDERTRMTRSLLASMLTMDDEHAKAYANDFQWVLDHGKGDVAYASLSALHTGARGLVVDDTMRLGQVWPSAFNEATAG